MNIRLRFFAILRDKAGAGEATLDLPDDGPTVDAALRKIALRFEQIGPFLANVAPAVNRTLVARDHLLRDGDELALIPPRERRLNLLSMDDWIDILTDALDIGAVLQSVQHPEAGGIDLFAGTTRRDRRADGVELVALDYEAYAEMAIEQMRAIRDRVKERWSVKRIAMVHRVGRVAIAEPSVIVAASCPHRGEAFEATRFLIDELKKSAAIWKKEVWADGAGTWVTGTRVEDRG